MPLELIQANIPAAAYASGQSVPALIQTMGWVAANVLALFSGWKIYQAIYLRRRKKDADMQA